MQCLHSTSFLYTFDVIEADYLKFLIMLGRLNARARFRAMAEESIPLSSIIHLGETSSSSQPVDRVAASKNLIY